MKLFYSLLFAFALPFCANAQVYAHYKFYNTQYDAKYLGKAVITEEYQVEIESKKGFKLAIFNSLEDDFQHLRSLKYTVFDKNGKKVKSYSKGDASQIDFDMQNIDNAFDWQLGPKYREYPFSVYVKAVTALDGYTNFPVWTPVNDFNVTTDESELIISRPKKFKLKIYSDSLQAKNWLSGSDSVSQFIIRSIPAKEQMEPYSMFYNQLPKVYVAPVNFELAFNEGSNASWKDFGNWFLNLNTQPYTLTPETKRFISSLGGLSTREKIDSIYHYFQDHTRYVSIQLGIGGFQARPSEEVEQKGYGDCKGLSNYLRNLLSAGGIQSYFIMAMAGRNAPEVNPAISCNQFNHVFLGVPLQKDTLLLEATSQLNPTNKFSCGPQGPA